MSGEQDAQTRLEQIIEKHVRSGNVIPFPTMSKHKQRPSLPRVLVRGTGNTVVVGNNNVVNVPGTSTSNAQTDAGETMREQHLAYIETNRQQMQHPDDEVLGFVQEHFGKDGLHACSVEELSIVRTQLVERWRHTF